MSSIHNTRLSKLKLDRTKEIDSLESPCTPPGAPVSAPQLRCDASHSAQEIWIPSRREWLIMVSLSVISLTVSLDATILVTALPNLAHAIHGTAAEAFWIGSSYLLTCAVFQPVIAVASKHLGSRLLLVISIIFFSLGTLFCAIAREVPLMIVGRCVQGIGGGGIITMTQIIFSDMIPFRQLPRYFALVLGSWSFGSLIGPVVGALLVQHTSWRWCFFLNFPFCGIGLIAALICIKEDRAPDLAKHQKILGIDWIGACLLLAGTASALTGVSFGGIQHPWKSAPTLAPIILGLLSLGLFALWQSRSKSSNLLPASIFCTLSSLAAYYCAFANGLVLYTALYYVPFYLLSVHGLTPVGAAIDLFPAVCLLVPGSILVAILISRYRCYRWAVWSGWAITTLGCGLFILFDKETSKAVFAISLAVFGVGNGLILTGVNVAAQAQSTPEDRSMAASTYVFMRSLGMPVGVAFSGSIFQNAMSRSLSNSGLTTTIAKESERFISVLQSMPETDPTKVVILECYTSGFKVVFICITVVSISGLVLGLVIKGRSMNT